MHSRTLTMIIALGLGSTAFADELKVAVCHETGSETNPVIQISVAESAAAKHFDEHGDSTPDTWKHPTEGTLESCVSPGDGWCNDTAGECLPPLPTTYDRPTYAGCVPVIPDGYPYQWGENPVCGITASGELNIFYNSSYAKPYCGSYWYSWTVEPNVAEGTCAGHEAGLIGPFPL